MNDTEKLETLRKILQPIIDWYIKWENDLDDGHILTPSIGSGAICKAFWVKNSPQHVTLLSEVYATKEKMKSFLSKAISSGINRQSVLSLAEGFGGISFRNELEDTK